MLTLIRYELKKLFGIKYLWMLLFVMLFFCSALFYYTETKQTEQGKFNLECAKAEFLAVYKNDPGDIEKAITEYREYEEYLLAVKLNELGMSIPEEDLIPVTYTERNWFYYDDGEPIPDSELISAINEVSNYINYEYPSFIDSVITSTTAKMELFDKRGAKDTPAYEYQKMAYDTYNGLKNEIELPLAKIYGWDKFFSYSEVSTFVFIYIVLSAGIIFTYEKTSGFLPVLRTAKNGCGKTAMAKMISVLIFSIFTVLIFNLIVFVLCWVMFGYSSPNLPIQTNVLYMQCPYAISVGEYAVAVLVMRTLSAVLFAGVIAIVSALTYSYALTFTVGIGLVGVSLITNYYFTSSKWAYINPMSIASSDKILGSYNLVVIFGKCVNVVIAAVILCVSVFIIASIGTILTAKYKRGVVTIGGGYIKTIISAIKETIRKTEIRHERKRKPPIYGVITVWEIKKLLPKGIIILCVFALVLSSYVHYANYSSIIASRQRSYDEKAFSFIGEVTEEKRQKLNEEFIECSGIKSAYNKLRTKALDDPSLMKEVTLMAEAASAAEDELIVLEMLNDKVLYLDSMEAETGIKGFIIPESGITRLLSVDFDVFLLIAVLVIFGRQYSIEYAGKSSEGNFSAIMRTTTRGRRDVFYGKLMATLIVSMALSIIFCAVDFLIGVHYIDGFSEIIKAPLLSLEDYGSIKTGLTIGNFILLVYTSRIIGFVLLSILISGISLIVKKQISAMFVSALIVFVPYSLVYMGVLFLRYVDVTAMLAGGKFIVRSAILSPGTSPYSFAVIFTLVYAAVITAVLIYERKTIGK